MAEQQWGIDRAKIYFPGEDRPVDFEELIASNLEHYKQEAALAFAIIQQNRHRSVYPYEWFGPVDEPCESGIDCECHGCAARFANATRTLDRQGHTCKCHDAGAGPCDICKPMGCEVWNFNRVATAPVDPEAPALNLERRASIFVDVEQFREESDRARERVGEFREQLDEAKQQSFQEEFDELRKLPKWSREQGRRILHVEWHLDRGDLICRCGEPGEVSFEFSRELDKATRRFEGWPALQAEWAEHWRKRPANVDLEEHFNTWRTSERGRHVYDHLDRGEFICRCEEFYPVEGDQPTKYGDHGRDIRGS